MSLSASGRSRSWARVAWRFAKLCRGVLVGVFALCFCLDASPELREVAVGGKIEIYGAAYTPFFEQGDGAVRFPDSWLQDRPMGPDGTLTTVRAADGAVGSAFFEQRTRLHVSASLSNDVSAFVEFEYIDNWGEDFRSNYLSGADTAGGTNRARLFQSYVDVNNLWAYPIRVRLGRQAMDFGSGWLVGSDPGPDPFTPISFDAVRLTWTAEPVVVDAWWSRLAESAGQEKDGNVDFYGVYLSFSEAGDAPASNPLKAVEAILPSHLVYHGFRHIYRRPAGNEEAAFDAYWLLVRDARAQKDTTGALVPEWIEDVTGVDDYGVTWLNTAGTRGAGTWNAVDWEIEAAYQWGAADSVGALFVPVGGTYGDSRARWSTWAGHTEFGYTVELPQEPRIFAGGSYYGSQDRRNVRLMDWLNPFYRPQASLSFNRLFSSWREDSLLDSSAMTNFWKAYAGINAQVPTEAVELCFTAAYYQAVAPFHYPAVLRMGENLIPLASGLPFVTRTGSRELGWQTSLCATYQYSEDLSLEVGWTHFFTGRGIRDGAFINDHGLSFAGGLGQDDVDYLYFYSTLEF